MQRNSDFRFGYDFSETAWIMSKIYEVFVAIKSDTV